MRSLLCSYCEVQFETARERKIKCVSGCGVIASSIHNADRRVTFGCNPIDPPSPVTRFRVEVVDGSGWAPEAGSEADLEIGEDAFSLIQGEEVVVATVPLAMVRDLRIEGQSVTSGGGFFGFGLGPVGALEGIGAASILNALTTSTKRWVTVMIAAEGGSVVLRINSKAISKVRNALRPLADATVTGHTPTSISLADELGKLADLRDRGVLTEEEFQTQKERLLR